MKTLFILILLYLAVCTVTVVAQTESLGTISQLPGAGPFKITPGSSFSASGSGPKLESSDPAAGEREKIIAQLSEALEVVRKNYAGAALPQKKDLVKAAITGSLRALDPHSNFFDAAEFSDLLSEENSEYSGIGATIVTYQKAGVRDTFIVSTYPGSSAAAGHLRFGDKIMAVNGEKVTGETSDVVRDKVRGRDGTVVRLLIERPGSDTARSVDLRRTIVPQPSIPDFYMIRPGVGYIDMSEGFNYTTSDELTRSLRELHQQGMTSLVLDLRGNPGGILDQAVRVAEKFLPSGRVIVSQRGRTRLDNRIWRSANKRPETLPLVVLVDENTASASEVVAGALQDHDRALIVGDRTFGKGLVQSVLQLPGGAGLTLTAARYFTPSGRSIQRDYSNGNLYDYYTKREELEQSQKNKLESRTAANRKVFGGNGIDPDEVIKQPALNRDELLLQDPIFFFVRETLANKVTDPTRAVGRRVRMGDFPISDALLDSFREFVSRNEQYHVSPAALKNETAYIRGRLRYQLTMAALGSISANQVTAEDDPQIAKALEALPRAGELALAATKLRSK